MYLYSAKTRGFYTREQHGDSIPLDAIPVSEGKHAELHAAGGEIKVSDAGVVEAVIRTTSLQERISSTEQKINSAYNRAAEKALAEYPAIERLGWDEQIRAVEKFDADPEAENMLLDMLASGNGRTRAEQAASIKAARQRYLNLYGALTAMRHTMDRQVKQAASLPADQAIAALNAIDVSAFSVLVEGSL